MAFFALRTAGRAGGSHKPPCHSRLRDSYESLAHDLLGDLPADDLARCRAVITAIEERLDDVVSSRVAAYGPASGPGPE
jgi:hypothetical protein